MKTITMYELLGMVKDGKAPKKIKTGNIIYELDDKKMIWADEIYHKENKDYIWLNFKHIKSLNDEVEIIEDTLKEEKKIPEKLNLNTYAAIGTEVDRDLIIKINEIIDYLDYLKSKGE